MKLPERWLKVVELNSKYVVQILMITKICLLFLLKNWTNIWPTQYLGYWLTVMIKIGFHCKWQIIQNKSGSNKIDVIIQRDTEQAWYSIVSKTLILPCHYSFMGGLHSQCYFMARNGFLTLSSFQVVSTYHSCLHPLAKTYFRGQLYLYPDDHVCHYKLEVPLLREMGK